MTFAHRHALIARAADLGFSLAGVVPCQPTRYVQPYLDWIEAGMHGTMDYMARPDRVLRRRDPTTILDGARSIVVVGLDYRGVLAPEILSDPQRGRIASYAWGQDYHTVMKPRLQQLADWLRQITARSKVYIDYGALLERGHGEQAGFGFIGKNTLLIHPRRGSLFFLGELVTTAEFDQYDQPLDPVPGCGGCTRCLNACPTSAFPRPFVLDARRCISYLTIEHAGRIDPALRPQIGNWVFGCDICQDVCPWQRFAPTTAEPAFATTAERAAPPLSSLLALSEAQFAARFSSTPVKRIGRDQLVRNACVAAGNSADPSLQPALFTLLSDPSGQVRAHAAWALTRLGTPTGKLIDTLRHDPDPLVQDELRGLAASG